jgi:hypothetical protein
MNLRVLKLGIWIERIAETLLQHWHFTIELQAKYLLKGPGAVFQILSVFYSWIMRM